MIDVHVSAMVAVDDADESNGGLEVVSGCFDRVLPLDERGCIDASVVEQLDWQPVPLRAGQTLWFHSRTPHRSGPNRSDQPRRALYPTYNAAREGDLRAAYYDAEARRVRVRTHGRPRTGLAHRRLRRTSGMRVVFTVLDALPVRHVGHDHTPGAPRPRTIRRLRRQRCARGDDLGDLSQPRDVQHRHRPDTARRRHELGAGTGPRRPGVEAAIARAHRVRRVPKRRTVERGRPR